MTTAKVFKHRAKGYEGIARRLSGRSPGEVRMSSVTLSELEYGFENSRHRDENRAALDATLVTDDFRHMPGVRLVNWLRR